MSLRQSHVICLALKRPSQNAKFTEEAKEISFPDYLWEKFSCVDTCGVIVSCAQLPQLVLTKNTVGNVYALLRHYCERDLKDRPVIPFGSHVHVAKCDESQFNKSNK